MNKTEIINLRDELAAPVIADLEALAEKVDQTSKALAVARTTSMLRGIAKDLFDPNLNVGKLRRDSSITDNNQSSKFEEITGKLPLVAIRDARFEIAFSLLKATERGNNDLIFESLGFSATRSTIRSMKALTLNVTPDRVREALVERQVQVSELFTLRDEIRNLIRSQNLRIEPKVSLDSPTTQEARQIATDLSLPSYTKPEDIERFIAAVVQEVLTGKTNNIFKKGRGGTDEQLWKFLQDAGISAEEATA